MASEVNKSAKELGKNGGARYIFLPCLSCGKPRWVKKQKDKMPTLCRSCSQREKIKKYGHPMAGRHHTIETRKKLSQTHMGKNFFSNEIIQKCRERMMGNKNPKWNGGRFKLHGYIYVKLYPDDFFYPMIANKSGGHKSYIQEHRLIMARFLKRCLLPWEIVHHRNGIKDDNRLENLQLLRCSKDHLPSQAIQYRIKKQEIEIRTLKKRITLLEAEIVLLKSLKEVKV